MREMPRGQLVEGDGSHGASSKKGGVLERQSFCRSITGKAVAALCAVGLCLAGALAIHGAQQAQAVDLHADNKLTSWQRLLSSLAQTLLRLTRWLPLPT